MDYINLPNFYSHNVSFDRNTFLNLIEVGRDIISTGFSYPQYQNMYVITFVKSGKGVLEMRGKKYEISQNDAFLTLPNELSIQTSDLNDPWELYYFGFNGSIAKDVVDNTVFKHGFVSILKQDTGFTTDILDAIYFLNNNSYGDLLLFEYLFKFLSYFDIYKNMPKIKSEIKENKYVSEIKKYIQYNYLKPIKISDIANELNINRSHLYRIFKEEIGTSIEEYIINIRINHAKALLKDTDFSVSAISLMTGYKNYTTFFKRFKQITGLTPLEYRNCKK